MAASKVCKEQYQSQTGDAVLKSVDKDLVRSQSSAAEGISKLKLRKDGKHHHDQGMKKFSANTSQQTISAPSSSRVLPDLQNLLKSVATQRDLTFKLINSIDPTFLARLNPKSMEEQKLLNQIAELQGKVLSVSEELHLMRAKNAQLESQLSSLIHKKEEQRAVS